MSTFDTSFEMLLLDRLGRDSMQNTDDPAEFATLLDLIAHVELSDLAKKAACQLLLHIHKDDGYAETLLFRRTDGQHEQDEDIYLIPMQTRFAQALYHCGEQPERIEELFPDAENLIPEITLSAREYLVARMMAIINSEKLFGDCYFSWATIITFAEQYTPDGTGGEFEVYHAFFKATKAKLHRHLGRAA